MSSRYAAQTQVPVARSKAELEQILIRYGAMVQFSYKGRNVKVTVPYQKGASEKAQRQRWRILLLLVKAQIEAVECGLMKFEEAFLPWMVLRDGSTVYETMQPQLPAPVEQRRLKEVNR